MSVILAALSGTTMDPGDEFGLRASGCDGRQKYRISVLVRHVGMSISNIQLFATGLALLRCLLRSYDAGGYSKKRSAMTQRCRYGGQKPGWDEIINIEEAERGWLDLYLPRFEKYSKHGEWRMRF